MNEEILSSRAEAIYSAHFGHLDDKYFRAEKLGEIEDWLATGDPIEEDTIENLIAEWAEYDAAALAANPA